MTNTSPGLLGRSVHYATGGKADTPREQQGTLSGWVEETLNEHSASQHLAAVAPTGTGKSLSYLVPAFERAVTRSERTLISTEGLGLQRQIVEKDAPAVAAAAQEIYGAQVKTAVLKGFSNYVCTVRAQTFARLLLGARGPMQSPDLIQALQASTRSASEPVNLGGVNSTWGTLSALFLWALEDNPDPSTKDRDSCPVLMSSSEWSLVSVSAQECKGEKCPLFEYCAPQAARDEAAEASVVVTNHTMLGIQAAKKVPVVIGNQRLGEFQHIVVDEAHSLPSVVRSHGSAEITGARIEKLGRRLKKEGSFDGPDTALTRTIESALETGRWAMGLVENTLGSSRIGQELRLEPDQNFSAFAGVAQAFNSLKEPIRKSVGYIDDEKEELVSAIDSFADDLEAVAEHRKNVARWMVRDRAMNGDVIAKICTSPVDVSSDLYFNVWTTDDPEGASSRVSELYEALSDPTVSAEAKDQIREDLEAAKDGAGAPRKELSVAAVSATLSKSFPYEAGLKTSVRSVSTPFAETLKKAALYTPLPTEQDLAVIGEQKWGKVKMNTAKHQDWCVDQICELVYANKGSAMVISATAAAGRRYADAIRNDPDLDFEVYTQWDPIGKAAAIDAWKADTSSVIVGTKSLMTGVDAPGETNTLVIIDRPPRSPLNPVDKARTEALIDNGENKFVADTKVYVEDASVLLAQAAGRLIRSASDRGMVAVLDPRLNKDSQLAYSGLVRNTYMKPLADYGIRVENLSDALDWLERQRGLVSAEISTAAVPQKVAA